jgi:hypothetical protein
MGSADLWPSLGIFGPPGGRHTAQYLPGFGARSAGEALTCASDLAEGRCKGAGASQLEGSQAEGYATLASKGKQEPDPAEASQDGGDGGHKAGMLQPLRPSEYTT